jgi:hypothetical protein
MAGAERPNRRYGWYLATSATWFGGLGLQQVMLPWLVAGELEASAEWIGLVQTANMLPGLVLLIVGGAVADRRDPRSMLTLLHVLATLPPLALATAIGQDSLSISVVVLCALAMGSLNAFSNPARDSLLSEVAGSDVARAVTGLTIAQFGSQGVGMLVAGAARWAGLVPVLILQASAVLVGALLSRGIPRRRAPPPTHGPSLGEFLVGLRIVLRSPLRAVLALTCGIGLLFSASYNVVLPVLVRDVYGGDVRDVSVLMMTFPVGTILGSFVLLARGGIRRKGPRPALPRGGAGRTGLGTVWRRVPQHGPHALPGASASERTGARAGSTPAGLHGHGTGRCPAVGLRHGRARPAGDAARLRCRHARPRRRGRLGERCREDGVS